MKTDIFNRTEQQARAIFEIELGCPFTMRLVRGVWVATFSGMAQTYGRRGGGRYIPHYAAIRREGSLTAEDLRHYHIEAALKS